MIAALTPVPKSGNRAGAAKHIAELELQLHRKDKARWPKPPRC